MDALEPSGADLLREAAPREVEPGHVEVRALRRRVADPDQDGGGVGHEAEPGLALLERLVGAQALGQVRRDAEHLERLAVVAHDRALDRLQPPHLAVGVGDLFLRDPELLEAVHDHEVAAPEVLDLRGVGVEVGVRLADQVFDARAVGVGHRLVDQREAALPVLGEDEIGIDVDHLPEEPPLLAQHLLGLPPLGDVDGRAGVALEIPGRGEPRRRRLEDPPVLAVGAAQPVLGLEPAPRREGRVVDRDEPGHQVVRVDAVARAAAELLREGPSGEVEPRLVEVGGHAVGVVHPDHHGRGVRHAAEPLLALAQRLFVAAALGHAADDADDADDFAGGVAVRAVRADDPAGAPGLLDLEEEVAGGHDLPVERGFEQLEAGTADDRGHVERGAAEGAFGGDARELLHVAIPHDAALGPVVDDDAFARAGDDLLAELVGLLELRARAPALGDVLDEPLVAEQAARADRGPRGCSRGPR